MGLMRKTDITLDARRSEVHVQREAQTKAAAAQGRAANQEAKLLKAQRKAQPTAASQQWDQVLAAIKAGERPGTT